jgi:hypothetical protein
VAALPAVITVVHIKARASAVTAVYITSPAPATMDVRIIGRVFAATAVSITAPEPAIMGFSVTSQASATTVACIIGQAFTVAATTGIAIHTTSDFLTAAATTITAIPSTIITVRATTISACPITGTTTVIGTTANHILAVTMKTRVIRV